MPYYPLKEAARLLDYHVRHVRRQVRHGQRKGYKVGKKWRAWVDSGELPPQTELPSPSQSMRDVSCDLKPMSVSELLSEVKVGRLRDAIREAGLTVDEFLKLLE